MTLEHLFWFRCKCLFCMSMSSAQSNNIYRQTNEFYLRQYDCEIVRKIDTTISIIILHTHTIGFCKGCWLLYNWAKFLLLIRMMMLPKLFNTHIAIGAYLASFAHKTLNIPYKHINVNNNLCFFFWLPSSHLW